MTIHPISVNEVYLFESCVVVVDQNQVVIT
jgi:hypothetical protein